MKFLPTALPGVLLIEPDVFKDPRGFFLETYQEKKYAQAGIEERFVQDNHSRSEKNTLRGLHAQLSSMQGKLVRVMRGEVFDVVVDIRRGSSTYKQWFGVNLSAENFRQLYVPVGFLHGFCVISDMAEVEYKCTDYYDPANEVTLIWNDPDVAVRWPIVSPVLSKKDVAGKRWAEIEPLFPDKVKCTGVKR